ncbi:MAG: DNA/RNA nuclease SfsA [Candidatus Bathyarchaeia archaeon]
MRIEGRLVQGIFRERLNRFLVQVEFRGASVPCFLPNPGRLREWLAPGTVVVLREVLKEGRKTRFDVIGVSVDGRRVSIDARVPNKVLMEVLQRREVEEFSMYSQIKPEWGYGHTRFDFLLTDGQDRCLLEVKSCTLVVGGGPSSQTRRQRGVGDI